MVDPGAIAPGSDTHFRLHDDDADRSILQAGRRKPASVRTGSGSDPIQAQLEWSIPALSRRVLTRISGCMTTMLIAQYYKPVEGNQPASERGAVATRSKPNVNGRSRRYRAGF